MVAEKDTDRSDVIAITRGDHRPFQLLRSLGWIHLSRFSCEHLRLCILCGPLVVAFVLNWLCVWSQAARYAALLSRVKNRISEAEKLQAWADAVWKGPSSLSNVLAQDESTKPIEDGVISKESVEDAYTGRYVVIDVGVGRVLFTPTNYWHTLVSFSLGWPGTAARWGASYNDVQRKIKRQLRVIRRCSPLIVHWATFTFWRRASWTVHRLVTRGTATSCRLTTRSLEACPSAGRVVPTISRAKWRATGSKTGWWMGWTSRYTLLVGMSAKEQARAKLKLGQNSMKSNIVLWKSRLFRPPFLGGGRPYKVGLHNLVSCKDLP